MLKSLVSYIHDSGCSSEAEQYVANVQVRISKFLARSKTRETFSLYVNQLYDKLSVLFN
ncbi:uncharacterized protein METZ01_LOCUS406683 [marine metagenome]|uniref:Uncharacterized protein n=1 Tax=marine metagenome TaxID=408172 RepID=A0A382W537_9ZZZZ